MQESSAQQSKGNKPSSDVKPTSKAPIIIKRITLAGHGHHGGAWKVAYADFVTAMMAFFLLLWLLNSVPTEKLKGVAQYFEPTVGLYGSKGIGFEGGKSSSKEGQSQYDKTAGVQYGVMSKGNIISIPQSGSQNSSEEVENERFSLVESELKKVMTTDAKLNDLKDNIDYEITPEGLIIKIMDQDKHPMFKTGSAELEPFAKDILIKVVNLIKYSPNFIAISGHTDSDISGLPKEYSIWELSADRANATRRFMVDQGVPIEQISRVVARADTEPLDATNLNSPKNRRIAITLLRNSSMAYNKISAPKQSLGVTEVQDAVKTN